MPEPSIRPREPEIIYSDTITDKIKKILIPYPTARYELDNVSFESLLKYCKSGLLAISKEVYESGTEIAIDIMDCIGYRFDYPDSITINMLDYEGAFTSIVANYNSDLNKVFIDEL